MAGPLFEIFLWPQIYWMSYWRSDYQLWASTAGHQLIFWRSTHSSEQKGLFELQTTWYALHGVVWRTVVLRFRPRPKEWYHHLRSESNPQSDTQNHARYSLSQKRALINYNELLESLQNWWGWVNILEFNQSGFLFFFNFQDANEKFYKLRVWNKGQLT